MICVSTIMEFIIMKSEFLLTESFSSVPRLSIFNRPSFPHHINSNNCSSIFYFGALVELYSDSFVLLRLSHVALMPTLVPSRCLIVGPLRSLPLNTSNFDSTYLQSASCVQAVSSISPSGIARRPRLPAFPAAFSSMVHRASTAARRMYNRTN